MYWTLTQRCILSIERGGGLASSSVRFIALSLEFKLFISTRTYQHHYTQISQGRHELKKVIKLSRNKKRRVGSYVCFGDVKLIHVKKNKGRRNGIEVFFLGGQIK